MITTFSRRLRLKYALLLLVLSTILLDLHSFLLNYMKYNRRFPLGIVKDLHSRAEKIQNDIDKEREQ